jgi:hypothetical protein
MRIFCVIVSTLIVSGCATMNYSSGNSAEEVSACIANGWRKLLSSGVELPVTVTRQDGSYFVDVVLVRDFPTFLPIRSMWAKVRESTENAAGSTTEYRRNLQMSHKKMDSVVVTCQNGVAGASIPDDALKANGPDRPPP